MENDKLHLEITQYSVMFNIQWDSNVSIRLLENECWPGGKVQMFAQMCRFIQMLKHM